MSKKCNGMKINVKMYIFMDYNNFVARAMKN